MKKTKPFKTKSLYILRLTRLLFRATSPKISGCILFVFHTLLCCFFQAQGWDIAIVVLTAFFLTLLAGIGVVKMRPRLHVSLLKQIGAWLAHLCTIRPITQKLIDEAQFWYFEARDMPGSPLRDMEERHLDQQIEVMRVDKGKLH